MTIGINDIECPICGGALKHYDKTKRIVRTKNRKTEWVEISRAKCVKCMHVARKLPGYILPYKQYEREVIIGVQDGLIRDDILGFEDYPCSITMTRWILESAKKTYCIMK